MSDQEKSEIVMTPGRIVAVGLNLALAALFVIAAIVAIGRAFGWVP